MSVQTTYADTPAVGFNGMLAEQFSLRQIDSGIAEGELGLGVAVVAGTSGEQVVAAAADAAVMGIVIYGTTEENQSGDFTYPDKSQLPVLSKGRYWAIANGALAIGAEAAYDPATGKVGAVSGGVTTLAFGVAKSASAADGDLIIVEVNF